MPCPLNSGVVFTSATLNVGNFVQTDASLAAWYFYNGDNIVLAQLFSGFYFFKNVLLSLASSETVFFCCVIMQDFHRHLSEDGHL